MSLNEEKETEKNQFQKNLRLAEQGNPQAQFNLGLNYYYGIGVEKSEQEKIKWFKKSAEQGYADAQYWLGICYENGIGVDKDEREALKWYKAVAEQTNSEMIRYFKEQVGK